MYSGHMALTIKNDDTEALTRELAEITGETITTAITVAVRERLELIRQPRTRRVDVLMDIARSVAPVVRARSIQIEDLYDEAGLPS